MSVFSIATKQIAQQKNNEKAFPKQYSCNFLESGIVSYQDVGAGIALLKKETIEKMLPSFLGKPVLIDHDDVSPENFKKKAVGYVTDAWFNPATGWFDCKFILTDDKAKEKVERDGYSVSCSFNVKDTGVGGEWHAIKFDEEITDGEFEHLALVTTPRYEECRIMVNSKKAVIKDKGNEKEVVEEAETKGTIKSPLEVTYGPRTNKEVKMFGLGKKNGVAHPSVDKNDPAKAKWCAENSFVKIGNEKVSMETLLNSLDNEGIEVSATDTIVYNDKEYAVKDLIALYQAKKKADKMEEDPEEKKKDDKKKEDDDKKCDDDKKQDDDKKKDDEKDEEDEEDEEKKNTVIGKDNPESKEIVDKAKSADKKKKDDEKDEEEDPEKKKNDVKYFKKLNSLKDDGTYIHQVAVDTLSNKMERGEEKYGSKKVTK